MKWLVAITTAALIPQLAMAQEQAMSPDDVRTAAREAFGVELADIENYPDSMVAGAWAWMQDVEDGEGALDPKTMQLIGLAVAAQIPCEYCTYYHRHAAMSLGASEQEVAEAVAMAGYVRNWSTVLYGTGADVADYHAMVDTLFAAQGQAPNTPALTDEELIASAVQGAPAAMSNLAQIVVWEEDGMRVLREGTSGWWCTPDNPNSPAPDPFCGDAAAQEWWTALMERREAPPTDIGLIYAELGVQIADNTDPFATEPPEGSDWITLPPHQGTFNQSTDLAGMVGSPTPDTTKPVVVWYDTPYAHYRQPMDW